MTFTSGYTASALPVFSPVVTPVREVTPPSTAATSSDNDDDTQATSQPINPNPTTTDSAAPPPVYNALAQASSSTIRGATVNVSS